MNLRINLENSGKKNSWEPLVFWCDLGAVGDHEHGLAASMLPGWLHPTLIFPTLPSTSVFDFDAIYACPEKGIVFCFSRWWQSHCHATIVHFNDISWGSDFFYPSPQPPSVFLVVLHYYCFFSWVLSKYLQMVCFPPYASHTVTILDFSWSATVDSDCQFNWTIDRTVSSARPLELVWTVSLVFFFTFKGRFLFL